MPTLKNKPRTLKSPPQINVPETPPKIDDLTEFVKEATQVKQLTEQAGWGVLERDLTIYKNEISKKLAYLNPNRPEFLEARILYLAADKIIGMVNDYQENRDIAMETLAKMDNPDLAVSFDVDTE